MASSGEVRAFWRRRDRWRSARACACSLIDSLRDVDTPDDLRAVRARRARARGLLTRARLEESTRERIEVTYRAVEKPLHASLKDRVRAAGRSTRGPSWRICHRYRPGRFVAGNPDLQFRVHQVETCEATGITSDTTDLSNSPGEMDCPDWRRTTPRLAASHPREVVVEDVFREMVSIPELISRTISLSALMIRERKRRGGHEWE